MGGGASGCTAAAALADAGENVLVLERGPSDLDRAHAANKNHLPYPSRSDKFGDLRFAFVLACDKGGFSMSHEIVHLLVVTL